MNKICCFTGHRYLADDKIENIIIRLEYEIDKLIEQSTTTFISGGALGLDQIAASIVISKKELGNKIKLEFALPCKDQDKFWDKKQKKLYNSLLEKGDIINYINEEYTPNCMKERNKYMIERSDCCVCAFKQKKRNCANRQFCLTKRYYSYKCFELNIKVFQKRFLILVK